MTLYELTSAMRSFDFIIDDETGEIINADELEKLEMDRNEKLKNCVFYFKNMIAEAEALKAEKLKLARRQQIAEKKAERMKKYLDYCLKGEEFRPRDDVRVQITYRKSEVVECDDWTKISGVYLRYKDPEPDRAEIKKAIKAGFKVEGCRLVERNNIQIK